jgi:hypothetical protein
MNLKIENNLCIIQIDGTTLVMSKEEFKKSLRLGKWYRRRQAMAPREAMMQERAEDARYRASIGSKR